MPRANARQAKLSYGDRVMFTAKWVRMYGGCLYEVAMMRGTVVESPAPFARETHVHVSWDHGRTYRVHRSCLWPVGAAE